MSGNFIFERDYVHVSCQETLFLNVTMFMSTWLQVDQEAFRCPVLQVQGHVVSNTSHTLCTPFPTLLSSSVWTDTQTWYTSKTCCLYVARHKTPQSQRQCNSRKLSSGRDTWAKWATSTESYGLYRLPDSARMQMAEQSSWFGVCIETSSIVTATST